MPLHPLLVHFPIVFWLGTPVLDGLALALGRRPWWVLGLGVTAAGLVIGALALTTGLLEYVALSETGNNDVRLAARHGVCTAAVWCVMAVKLAGALAAGASATAALALLAIDMLACVLLLQGIFLGTRITYGGYWRGGD